MREKRWRDVRRMGFKGLPARRSETMSFLIELQVDTR